MPNKPALIVQPVFSSLEKLPEFTTFLSNLYSGFLPVYEENSLFRSQLRFLRDFFTAGINFHNTSLQDFPIRRVLINYFEANPNLFENSKASFIRDMKIALEKIAFYLSHCPNEERRRLCAHQMAVNFSENTPQVRADFSRVTLWVLKEAETVEATYAPFTGKIFLSYLSSIHQMALEYYNSHPFYSVELMELLLREIILDFPSSISYRQFRSIFLGDMQALNHFPLASQTEVRSQFLDRFRSTCIQDIMNQYLSLLETYRRLIQSYQGEIRRDESDSLSNVKRQSLNRIRKKIENRLLSDFKEVPDIYARLMNGVFVCDHVVDNDQDKEVYSFNEDFFKKNIEEAVVELIRKYSSEINMNWVDFVRSRATHCSQDELFELVHERYSLLLRTAASSLDGINRMLRELGGSFTSPESESGSLWLGAKWSQWAIESIKLLQASPQENSNFWQEARSFSGGLVRDFSKDWNLIRIIGALWTRPAVFSLKEEKITQVSRKSWKRMVYTIGSWLKRCYSWLKNKLFAWFPKKEGIPVVSSKEGRWENWIEAVDDRHYAEFQASWAQIQDAKQDSKETSKILASFWDNPFFYTQLVRQADTGEIVTDVQYQYFKKTWSFLIEREQRFPDKAWFYPYFRVQHQTSAQAADWLIWVWNSDLERIGFSRHENPLLDQSSIKQFGHCFDFLEIVLNGIMTSSRQPIQTDDQKDSNNLWDLLGGVYLRNEVCNRDAFLTGLAKAALELAKPPAERYQSLVKKFLQWTDQESISLFYGGCENRFPELTKVKTKLQSRIADFQLVTAQVELPTLAV